MSLFWIYALLGFVALQRCAELIHSRRNVARLLAQGGREVGESHYFLFVWLHGGWLLAMLLLARPTPSVPWLMLGAFFLLQLLRLWVIASLGPYWTTRIVTVPGAPLRKSGPYRWLRHPNYCIVAIEIPLLPLALNLPVVALVFGILNLLLLAFRLKEEERALAPRRPISGG